MSPDHLMNWDAIERLDSDVDIDDLLLVDSLLSTCAFNAQGELILEGEEIDEDWEDEVRRVFNL